MINGQIRDKEIRVIGENGDQLGIMSPREAMKLAQEADLDLVKIAPKAQHLFVRLLITVSTDMNLQERKKRLKRNRRPLK